ncbi:WD40-repeat-containing domain protein [Gilbertella persicaria]|nr:WD40-repeat-containing domain protein [Gilbertella persicaria]KAI8072152.1 WD40-repeat-containing domain protein [Gilbertella persicaria]
MIRWIPGSDDLFVATFKNGCVMIMDKERDDQSFSIPEPTTWVESQFTALRPHKSSKYNPVSCWKISTKGLTDFAFSPDGVHLAVTGVDGQLRVIDFRNERLLDVYSSYYGKLNCVDWSPDGRYILTGGEDDLVTLWSFLEKKMVARCQGHKSWVTGVAFDRWKCDEQTYRFASVGEDCNLIFWDFSYSALQKPKHPRVVASSPTSPTSKKSPILQSSSSPPPPPPPAPQPIPPTPAPLAPLLVERKKSLKTHRLFRGFSSPDTSTILSSSSTSSNSSSTVGSSFSRFRKRSSRSHNLFSNSSSNTDFTAAPVEDTVEEQWKQQHLPVLHPPLKKNQAAILQPTTIRAIHADPCLSVTFRQDTIVTTDRRGRIRTWGRP